MLQNLPCLPPTYYTSDGHTSPHNIDRFLEAGRDWASQKFLGKGEYIANHFRGYAQFAAPHHAVKGKLSGMDTVKEITKEDLEVGDS